MLVQSKYEPLVNDILEKFESREFDILCIAMCGSRAMGFGLANSDIDLVMVLRSLSTTMDSSAHFKTHVFDGARVEILLISEGCYRRHLDEIMETSVCRDARLMTDKFIHFSPLYRPEEFTRIRSSFDAGKFARISFNRIQKEAMNVFEDINAAVKAGNAALSVLWMRVLVDKMVEAYVAKKGDHYRRHKWLSERFRNSGVSQETLEKYLDISLNSPPIADADCLAQWMIHCLQLCRILQLESIFGEVPNFTSQLSEALDPFSLLVVIEGNFLLCGTSKYLRIDQEGALNYLYSSVCS